MLKNEQSLVFIILSCTLLLGACDPLPLTDAIAPTLLQVTPVPNGNTTTPSYTFSSNKAGTITYGGDCSSATTAAIIGNNTITFNALPVAVHSNCTINVIDATANKSDTLVVSSFTIGKPINDTGIIGCGDYAFGFSGINNNAINCASGASPSSTISSEGTEIANGLDPIPAGQDATYGRDANSATNSDVDGWKGFSYTKLKADGVALVDQTQAWSVDGSGFDNGDEAGGNNWSCIKDNVTGLTWEVKTNKPTADYRDKDAKYTWYNSNGIQNGGDAGTADAGSGNTCFNVGNCDTQKYVAYVNAQTLCGADDWRMPTQEELKTLRQLNAINPAIDVTFIPNTIAYWYWSASSYAGNNTYAAVVNFYDSDEAKVFKYDTGSVRLVRSSY